MLIDTEYQVTNGKKAIVQVLHAHYGDCLVIGAEVGVLKGENAFDLLGSLNVNTLYLIDPYVEYNDFNNTADLEESKQIAHVSLAQYDDHICWIEAPSLIAATMLPNELDFVYLDNSHRYLDVIAEIPVWYKKLKKGGVLCGDDFLRSGIRGIESELDMDVFKAVCAVVAKTGVDVCISKNAYAEWWMLKDRESLDLWT